MEIIIGKSKPKTSVHNPGDQKTGIFPFVTKNINGEDTLVKSAKHRRELMKEHNVHDDRVSTTLQNQRRRLHVEAQKEKKENFLTDTFMKAKYGKTDLRPMDMAMRKAEYERRNHAL